MPSTLDRAPRKNKGPRKGPSIYSIFARSVGGVRRLTGDEIDVAAADIDVGEFAIVEPHQLFIGSLVSAPALVEPDKVSPKQHGYSPDISRPRWPSLRFELACM